MVQRVQSKAQAESLRPILLLTLWVGILLVIRGPHQSLMAHDEGWYAQQARWIVENGDWITQQWWGELIYDRCMGIQWLIAASYHLFGVNETAARLPGVLSTLGAVWLTYAIGQYCMPQKTAFLGAAILAATPIWMQSGRLATQDIPLTFVELLGIWALLQAETERSRRWQWGGLAGSTFGLGFMIKGFMVIPVAVALMPYLVFDHRRHRHLANPGLYLGLVLGALPVLLWLGLSGQRYGWLPIENLFGKFFALSQTDYHAVGPFYYLWNIPANAFPWPLLAVPGLVLALRNPCYLRRLLWVGYPVFLLIELTLFKTRTWYYPLQLMPFVGLLAAVTLVALARLYVRRRSRLPAVLSCVLAGVGIILMGLGLLLLVRSSVLGIEPAWAYGVLGVIAGVGWLVPLGSCGYDHFTGRRSPRLWIAGWLLGPWLAVAVAYGTGLWGDYSSAIKRPLQVPPMATVLQTQPIHFVFPDWNANGAAKETVLLTFYTPHLGQRWAQGEAVPAGEYAWMHREMLSTLGVPYDVVGNAQDWYLIRLQAPSS